jgi:prephenate dehydrogenase
MGRLLARGLAGLGMTIAVNDLDQKRGRKVAESLGVGFKELPQSIDDEIVLVSVPLEKTVEVCRDVASRMKRGSLLIDISSVKTGVADRVASFIPEGVEYISIHPLFGPAVRSLRGKSFAVVPVKSGRWLGELERTLRNLSGKVVVTDIREHDRVMGTVQVLHHFAYLCLAACLVRSKVGEGFSTESFAETMRLLKRIGKNLEVVLSIQRDNPEAQGVREKFVEVAEELARLGPEELRKTTREAFKSLAFS